MFHSLAIWAILACLVLIGASLATLSIFFARQIVAYFAGPEPTSPAPALAPFASAGHDSVRAYRVADAGPYTSPSVIEEECGAADSSDVWFTMMLSVKCWGAAVVVVATLVSGLTFLLRMELGPQLVLAIAAGFFTYAGSLCCCLQVSFLRALAVALLSLLICLSPLAAMTIGRAIAPHLATWLR
jgi:hypothetical protein